MRFALLCDDPSVSPIVDALCSRVDDHRLSYAVSVTSQADLLLRSRAAVTVIENWEDLLIKKDIDAVLIGGSDPRILDAAKQLATAGIPILFASQAAQGSTFVYELSLIRDDNRVSLFPLFWHRYDAAVIELKTALTEGRLGRIQFLQLNRTVARQSSSSPIAQSDVDAELLHDTDLLRWLIGDYDQVTGLRTAATTEGVLMQSVVLAGRTLPEANWSVSPTDGIDQWRLTVRGERGVAELTREARRWVCTIGDQRVAGDEKKTAQGVLASFAASVKNDVKDLGGPTNLVGHEWGDLVKCFETIDATHRSVRRKRTIELHFEPMSERAIFKTQMTAIGCGLLVATFFLTLCFLGIASIVPLPNWLLIGLRFLVFAPLVLFLFAQVLLPLTRPSSDERTRF